MSNGMSVNIEAISRSATEIMTTSDTLAREVASFRGQVDGLADAFGGDALGAAVGMIYQVISDAAFESFADNADGLGEIGRNLQAMADDYTAAENANTDFFRELLGNLG